MSSAFQTIIEGSFQRLNLRWGMPVLAVLLYVVAWNRGIAILYGMCFLIMSVVALSWAIPRWNLAGVSATRTHPRTAVEGERITLTVRIAARGRRNRYMLSVHDRLAFVEGDGDRPLAFVARMRRSAQLDLQVGVALRGEYRLGPLAVRSGYPLGITTAETVMPDAASELLVYPQWFPIRQLPFLDRCRAARAGSTDAPRKGESAAVLGIREYCRGDSPRTIHWPSSAKRGVLMVKEFESNTAARVLIVLDLHRRSVFGQGRDSTLEYSVKIAASIAAYALGNGHAISVMGMSDRLYDSGYGHGGSHFKRVLDVLARVTAKGHMAYADVVRLALQNAARDSMLVCFDSGYALHPGEALGNRPSVTIRFDAQSFVAPGAAAPRGARCPDCYEVACGDRLERVFQ